MDLSAMDLSVEKCTENNGSNFAESLDNNYTPFIDNWEIPGTAGYPMIYSLSIYHLYHVIVFGRIVHLLWYFIGAFGNTVSLHIWTSKRMKRVNTLAVYFAGVIVCDITYQILHFFIYLKYFWGLPSLGVTGVCQIWNILYMVPQYASQLLVIAFTIERFISIIRPFKGERFSKRQRAPKILVVITIFVFFVAAPQAYFWKVDMYGFCEIRTDKEVLDLYTVWTFVSESVIFFVVPFATLILNIFVLRETGKSLNRHKSLNVDKNGSSRVHRKGRNYRPSTTTLLCVSFFRILTQLPVSITYTMQNIDAFNFGEDMPLAQMSSDPQWRGFIPYWGARIVIEVVGASHHALSIFIFYVSTKQFRNEIGKMGRLLMRILGRQSSNKRLDRWSELRWTSSVNRTTIIKDISFSP